LRIQLGLKPLEATGTSQSAQKDKAAEDNYADYKRDLAKKREVDEMRERLDKYARVFIAVADGA
jgi:hypothetical protein